MLAAENYKLDSLAVLQVAFGSILEKAIGTPIPASNISDDERNVLLTNEFMVKLIFTCLNVLGPHFIFNQIFGPMLEPMTSWLIEQQIPQRFDKKNSAKSISCLKAILTTMRANP